jgi:hypothetical protein
MEELILAWYSRNRVDLPWRETHDPYAILVSEVMLQQSPIGSTRMAEKPVNHTVVGDLGGSTITSSRANFQPRVRTVFA